jgi:hypothetical protein
MGISSPLALCKYLHLTIKRLSPQVNWALARQKLALNCACPFATPRPPNGPQTSSRQIEHHLFPAISFVHYPAIARIVRDECFRRNVRYTHYKSLWGNLSGFLCCMKQLGSAPDEPAVRAAVSVRGAGGKAKAT